MSLWPGKRCVLVFGCICVVFIVSVHDCVIELGKPVFDRWISDYDSLLDLSLWAMADLLLTAFQCRVAMQYRFGGSLKFWEKMLLYCPPVIIFPVLFYLHFSFFYWFPGLSFGQGTGLFGVCILGIVSGGTWGVKKLLPEVELRLELTVLLAGAHAGGVKHGCLAGLGRGFVCGGLGVSVCRALLRGAQAGVYR